MLRVVEGRCRFRKIDAVLRNVRFFFLGIPFKSHRLFTLAKYGMSSIYYCNITLWVAGHLLGSARDSRAGEGGLAIPNFCIFPLSRLLRRHSLSTRRSFMRRLLSDGGNASTAIYYCPVLAFVERCDTFPFLELA